MADNSSIEWTDATWNPVRGCSRLSPGCGGPNHQGGCYAEKIAARFSGPGQPFEGFAERTAHGGRWTGKMALVEDMLTAPLHWKKPRRIFVNSMSDLFHADLPDEAIDRVFAVMALSPQHTFQVLTKRADRMREYVVHVTSLRPRFTRWAAIGAEIARAAGKAAEVPPKWPLPNVWLGVSVEDQQRADERIPDLLATPAAVRFLSCEPLLQGLRLDHMETPEGFFIDALKGEHWHPGVGSISSQTFTGKPRLDWIIVGGESGPRSRPFALEWARSIVAQCKAAGVACFVKQLGAKPGDRASPAFCHEPVRLKDKKGGDMSEWPEDLRVRELPT